MMAKFLAGSVRMLFGGCLMLAMLASNISQGAEEGKDIADEAKVGDEVFTLESVSNPPQREIKFEHSTIPDPAQSRNVPPDWIYQNKFVVSIRLEVRRSVGRAETAESSVFPLSIYEGDSIFGTSTGPNRREMSWPERFAALLEQVPKEQKPAPEIVAYFTNLKPNQIRVERTNVSRSGSSSIVCWSFRFGADSAEQAEAIAKGLLTMFDWGLSRPLQLEVWKRRAGYVEQHAAAQRAVQETGDRLGPHRALLGRATESPTKQLIELTIERVGVEARIKALDQNPPVAILQKNLLEANAELAEIDAKMKLLNDLGAYRTAKYELERVETYLRNETFQLAAFAPVPLIDNQVQIIATGSK
jgi:hypothetical protein